MAYLSRLDEYRREHGALFMVRGGRAGSKYTKRYYYEAVRRDIRRNRVVYLRKQTLAQLKNRVRY